MTQSPNKTGLNAGEMPAEIFVTEINTKYPWDGSVRTFTGHDNAPKFEIYRTKYVRADLVEKVKEGENG